MSEERKECHARCVCGKTGVREEGEVPSSGCSVGPGKARREMNGDEREWRDGTRGLEPEEKLCLVSLI